MKYILILVLLFLFSACTKSPYREPDGTIIYPGSWAHDSQHFFRISPLYKAYNHMPLDFQDSLFLSRAELWTFEEYLGYERFIHPGKFKPNAPEGKMVE